MSGVQRPLAQARRREPGSRVIHELVRERSRSLAVSVVVVPPPVRRGLRVTLRRVLPLLLAAERRDVEVGPGGAHPLVTAGVDEVGAEDLVAVADEGVGAVPLV